MNRCAAFLAILLCAPAFGQTAASTGTDNTGGRAAGSDDNFNPNAGNQSRDTNPAASNPNLPLPGTANPNNRAAPMVPNPVPAPAPGRGASSAPGPIVIPSPGGEAVPPGRTFGPAPFGAGAANQPGAVPGPGGAQGSPAQPSPRKVAEGEERGLRDIREAVQRGSAGEQEAAADVEPVKNLKVVRRNGKIVLTGTVRSEAEKQAAGERAAEAAAGQQILNRIKVK